MHKKAVYEVTVEFLKWVLTEGQKIVEENGYTKLPGIAVKNTLSEFK